MRVLRQRFFAGIPKLTLELEPGKGTVVMPREWTDLEPPSLTTAEDGKNGLGYEALIRLIELVDRHRVPHGEKDSRP